jgi:hypothetical protein
MGFCDGGEMLNRKQVIALAALGFGILVALGVYYVWPNGYWPVYVAIALVVAGAFKAWLELIGQGKIMGST